MKTHFHGYYTPTKEEFDRLWANCLFAFDASVLLNLYRYSEHTKTSFLNTLTSLGNRIWLPHQAALEYHRRRLGAINDELRHYDELLQALQPIHDRLRSQTQHPFVQPQTSEAFGTLFKTIESELKAGKKAQKELQIADPVLDKITLLFDKRVGEPYSKEKATEIERIGKDRYARKVPPGFLDRGKTAGDPFGDLILWNQLLDQAKLHKSGLIFILDDLTDDWWIKHGSGKIPHPSLREEMKAGSESAFYAYTGQSFVENARDYLDQHVEDEVIQEMKDAAEERRLRNVVLHAQPAAFSDTGADSEALVEQHANALAMFTQFLKWANHIKIWCDLRQDPSQPALFHPTISKLGMHGRTLAYNWGEYLPENLGYRLSAILDQCDVAAALPVDGQIRKADYLRAAVNEFINDLGSYLGASAS